jgi:hypothetical protein
MSLCRKEEADKAAVAEAIGGSDERAGKSRRLKGLAEGDLIVAVVEMCGKVS